MSSFWTNGDDRHQEIAKTFYQNIEYDWRPYDYVTSRRMCPCLEYCNRCSFPLDGKVERISYNGPNIENIK